ncbi:M1 family metallopeptidase [Actinoplanes derwentensis]|uniref:Aminopeptidase N n=1 Tax=Actinoplanes derwentensis TaxID=113562 RepID=A0A1H2CN74_9ACTN|nr:M1 family metallopeptidase [Actinoplanes derwentensis]SDT71985.1 Peptidase family M1 [Actinoplanes derwentensis]
MTTINNRLTGALAVTTAALVGIAGTAVPASAAAAAKPGSAGLGDRLYPLLGNGGYDVTNYYLRLKHPAKNPNQQVNGSVTISAIAIQSLSRFNLDFAGDGVGSVYVNGKVAKFARSGEELVITPASYLPKGKSFRVTVNGFTATPVVAGKAAAPDGFVATKDGTVLAGQPDTAHNLFPSNDHPRDKATYTVAVTVPSGWKAVASGKHVKTTTAGGYVTSTYREAKPMASELAQIVAGDFVVHNRKAVGGVPIRDVFPRRLASKLTTKAKVEKSQMTWLTKKVGAYPFENYGSLVIEADLGFALETQTLSLYDTNVFSLPGYILNPIMAHELAHQWFGNSVAPSVWSDVWLNEGHATWYEMLYASDTKTFKKYTGLANREAYFKAVYQLGDRYRAAFGPVAKPKGSASVWDVFNPNVYDGGALALYALQQKIGAKKFAKIEREWVKKYRGKSASTAQFIALASKVSGQNLKPFLTRWLYGKKTPAMPGHSNWKVSKATASAAGVSDLLVFPNRAQLLSGHQH